MEHLLDMRRILSFWAVNGIFMVIFIFAIVALDLTIRSFPQFSVFGIFFGFLHRMDTILLRIKNPLPHLASAWKFYRFSVCL